MGYVEHVLQPGETLVHKSKLHWFIYWPVAPFLAVFILGLLLWGAMANGTDQQQPNGLADALLAVGAIGTVVTWLRVWIRRTTTELAVTDRRVIFKRGLIRRHTVEMNMDKVESVDVDQSIFGRLFGYGTVTVHGTGGGLEPFPNIDAPIEFRNHVTGA